MNSNDSFTDVARDPSGIIFRSSFGSAVFFVCYAALALSNSEMQRGFWLSFCLGLLGCMATNRVAAIRFVLLLASVALLRMNSTVMVEFAWR